MKKIVSLIMAVVMLATMLTVFTVPVAGINALVLDEDFIFSRDYDDYNVMIKSGSEVAVTKGVDISFPGTLHILSSATLTVEPKSSLTVITKCDIKGNLIIKKGATAVLNNFHMSESSSIEIAGKLKGNWDGLINDPQNFKNVTFVSNGKIEMTFNDEVTAKTFIRGFPHCETTLREIDESDSKYIVTVYGSPDLTSSTLSVGNIWIIIAVAVIMLGAVAALVIIKKKKKPVLASGAETEGGVNLTNEQLKQVYGGSALGTKAGDTVILEQSDASLTGAAVKVD